MNDKNIITILEFLEPIGYKHTANISPILNQIFLYPKGNQPLLEGEKNRIISFLDGLLKSEFIEYDRKQINTLGWDSGWDKQEQWMGESPLLASIGVIGLKTINDKRNKDIEQSVNKSVISTNKSVESTNIAIIELSKTQQSILDRQTTIFLFTALFALGSVVVSGFSLYRDIHKDTLNKQLLQLSKDTLLLNLHIKKLKTDSSLSIMAKKNLTKK